MRDCLYNFFCCEKLTLEENAYITECGRNSTALSACAAFIAFSIISGGPTLNIVGTAFHTSNATLVPIAPLSTFLAYGLGANLGYNGIVAILSTREAIRLRYFENAVDANGSTETAANRGH